MPSLESAPPLLRKSGNINAKKWKIALMKVVDPLFILCALPCLTHPPWSACRTPPFHFHQNLKACTLIGWIASMALVLTLVGDPRGVSFASHAINETFPSFTLHHSSEYCYATIFSPSLSLSLSSCFISLVLEELGATLFPQPLPFGNKKSLEELWSTGLGLGFPIYCEVKLFFESFCEILSSCLDKLVYLARCSNSVVAHLYVLYMLVI